MNRDVQKFLHGSVLTKVDRATMFSSIESRAPFLDERIFNYARRLPDKFLIRREGINLTSKYILRKLLSRYINLKISKAPKRGFDVPMSEWLRGPLKDMCFANIEQLISRNIIQDNQKNIENILKEHIDGKNDYSKRLWNLISLNLWFKEQ